MSWLPPDDDDDGDYAEYDESAARVRPNPKGNKPRSKIRPEHADAVSTGRGAAARVGGRRHTSHPAQ